MAQFYDSLDRNELARIEWMLKQGGVEFTRRPAAEGSLMFEILVAAEDFAYADALLTSQSGSVH